MDHPIKDITLRLLHVDAERAFIERKLANSAVTIVIGLALGITLFAMLSHATRWSLGLGWLIPISLLPLGIVFYGARRLLHYRSLQQEHLALLRKYNRL